MKVNKLPTDYFYRWLDDEDTKAMIDHFGRPDWLEGFRSFMVWVENGEYKEVYGCETKIPYLDSEAEQLVTNGKIVEPTILEDFHNFNEFMTR